MTPSTIISVVTMEETATPIVAIVSPSSVPCEVSVSTWALMTTGIFKFITFPVKKVKYAEEPRIGV